MSCAVGNLDTSGLRRTRIFVHRRRRLKFSQGPRKAGWAASLNRVKTTKIDPPRFSPGVENEWAHGGTGQPNMSVCLSCETSL